MHSALGQLDGDDLGDENGATLDEKIAAARAEVQRARATRDRAKYFYDQTRIYAPAAGTALTSELSVPSSPSSSAFSRA